MKVLPKSVLIVVLNILALNVCHSQDELINNDHSSECSIPNQRKTKGICVDRKNCLEYESLFNVTDLTVERLSFIMNLDCGFDYDMWKTLICCPQPGSSYKYVKKKWPWNKAERLMNAHVKESWERLKTVEWMLEWDDALILIRFGTFLGLLLFQRCDSFKFISVNTVLLFVSQNSVNPTKLHKNIIAWYGDLFSLLLCRKPDLAVDPENLKVRESLSVENTTATDDDSLDNRFSATSGGNKLGQKKCGWQAFMQRIVGGEICEIDEFPWAALLLYESSGNQ
jgi:Regulatory CLIP domain of proteinases